MRILVPDLPPFHALTQPGDLKVPGVEVAFYRKGEVPAGEVDGVVLWFADAATTQQLVALPGLKWLLTLSAGIDHVKGILPPGVALYNANRLHNRAVAAHVVAGMLAAMRGLYRFRDSQNQGKWDAPAFPTTSGLHTLEGQQVVIWGYGHIGKLVEQMLEPFGATVFGVTSKTEPDLLEYRLAEADWVILLLPSTAATRGLINAERLSKLKKGVWLSNQGRGNLIVTADLIAALDSGQVGGAVLDVTDPEPLPDGHPLWHQPNVIITPHVASTTADLIERGVHLVRDFVLDMTQGNEPEGRVAQGSEY